MEKRPRGADYVTYLLCAAAVGCASFHPRQVDFTDAAKNYGVKDYPAVYDTWTRHAKLVQETGTVMEIWATFMSWDFRQAYLAKYAKVYDLPGDEYKDIAKSQKEEADDGYEIHLVAQSTSDRWNDLERKNSAWSIALLDGTGAVLSPSSIKVEKLPEIYESSFFPNRTPFSRTYKLRFVNPKEGGKVFVGPRSRRMILRIDSPVGKVEVVWEARGLTGT
jgi:hypothetical protein